MPPNISAIKVTDVPAQIFNEFLTNLEATKMSAEVVARLRKTLVEDRTFTELALRKAVLGEEDEA